VLNNGIHTEVEMLSEKCYQNHVIKVIIAELFMLRLNYLTELKRYTWLLCLAHNTKGL